MTQAVAEQTTRMTVYIEQKLVNDAKHAAIDEGRSLSELVQDAVERYLKTQKTQRS